MAGLVSALQLIAGCSAGTPSAGTEPGTTPGTTAGHSEHAALPSAHVHGVARDPGTGSLILATHEGLFRYGDNGPQLVGPAIDLMGFTIAGPGHYYASGHPNVVMELPQPMGLIESTDGGETWKVLSRGGESDFHALAKAGDTVVAFDGQLRRTTDGRSWQSHSIPAAPRSIASDPAGTQVLATTRAGLLRSMDRGATWTRSEGAPLLLLVAWADEQTVVGVSPDGTVAVSRDAAKTWRTTGKTDPAPQALSASMTTEGLEILVVTDDSVMTSTDGATFAQATT